MTSTCPVEIAERSGARLMDAGENQPTLGALALTVAGARR